MIEAKVIEHSISDETEKEVVTFQLRYPRFIHSEFMTHRVFSRNASSSRAIPTSKLSINEVVEPARWGKNQPGMQPSLENLEGDDLEKARKIWHFMAEVCETGCRELAKLGLHKQWSNRPLEWFTTIDVVVTSTEWRNFYKLRDHPDAQDEIRLLAQAMKKAVAESKPKVLKPDQWHLPYITKEDRINYYVQELIKMSAARCARVSYLTHDKKNPTIADDYQLFYRLTDAIPPHMSPLEHQCTPDRSGLDHDMWGNLVQFIQHRRIHENGANINEFIEYRPCILS